jgi:hypothetical protein
MFDTTKKSGIRHSIFSVVDELLYLIPPIECTIVFVNEFTVRKTIKQQRAAIKTIFIIFDL